MDKLYSEKTRLNWHKFFIFASLSFLAGLFVGNVFSSDPMIPIWLGFLLLFVWLGISIYSCSFRKLIPFIIITAIGFFCGLYRVNIVPNEFRAFEQSVGQSVSFMATILGSEERETLLRLEVEPDNAKTNILLWSERFPMFQKGDRVKVSGRLSKPKQFSDTSGDDFDYPAYLAGRGIYFEIYRPKIELLEPASLTSAWPLRLKKYFLSLVNKNLPEPESSLLAGILLGAKNTLPKSLTDNFRDAGLSHIVVLSGFNITLVAESILKLFVFLPRMAGGVAGLLSIIVFGLVAGGGSLVWRAVLMAGVALYAKLSGRLYDVASAIIFSASALAVFKPNTLTNDMGFQLSILALLGLVYLSPIIESKIAAKISNKFILQMIASTFGAQIAVLPFIWFKTGQIGLIGFVSNLFVLPVVPLAMTIGFFMIVVSVIFGPVSLIVAMVELFILKIMILLVRFFSFFSGLDLNISSGTRLVFSLLIYGGLSVWVIIYYRKQYKQKILLLDSKYIST